MNKEGTMGKPDNGTSKLALLRQNRSIQKQEVNIEKAIDGYVSSIDSQTLIEEIARNSSIVNLIIDCSGSMEGTSQVIAREINRFAIRQAAKIYTTKISLTVFDDEVYQKFGKQNVKQFVPIQPWSCNGGTNIYDALFSAITPVLKTDANHKLHLLITDGQNGSSRHTQEEVYQLITSRIQSGEHIFLLYNNEYESGAKEYALELGIKSNNAVNFNRNGDGIKIIFQTIEDLLDGLRTKGTVPEDWAKAITAHAANPFGIKARETLYLE